MQSIFRGLPSAPSQQRGMATILIIMLMGLALTVTALGVMYSVRTSQEQQVTVHAATHSQAGVWTAAEAVGLYLKELDKTALMAFNPEKPLKFKINDNNVVAKIFPLDVDTAPHHLRAEISYTDTAAKATSTLEVVYNITFTPKKNEEPSTQTLGNNVLSFATNMSMSGSITMLGGDAAIFNVDGDVLLEGSVKNIKTIQATGHIVIKSSIDTEEIFSNETITLEGSASVIKASALGNIFVKSGGGNQGILNSNSNIIITGGNVNEANALGSITATSGGATHGIFTAGKNIEVKGNSLQNANAIGHINIEGNITVIHSKSLDIVTCPKPSWSNFTSIRAQIATKNCKQHENIIAPDTTVSVTTMTPLTKVILTRPKVDAYSLKSSANYIFQIENNKIKVSVRNINSLPNGDYYLGEYNTQNNDRVDYLCKEVSDEGLCSVPTSYLDSKTICQGNSNQNACFSFKNRTWEVTGKNLAPGIMWFEGNLALKNGDFYNTFIATGDIETGGNHVTTAVNYAGYQAICLNQYPKNATARFNNLYPTNFCNEKTTLINNSIGNIALLAGGYVDARFEGGIIALGGSSEIFGSVIAGDSPATVGNTIIHGYVTAAGQGSSVVSPFKGSTTIDLRNLPSGYNPGEIPDMGTTPGGGGSGDDDGETIIKILWSRYL